MRGEFSDYVTYPNGDVKLVHEASNLIVSGAHIILASCLMQNSAYQGFEYWAIGDGNVGGAGGTAAWDAGVLAGSITPSTSDTALANEIFRKATPTGSISFIDALGAASITPTNRLLVTCTFLETEPTSSTYYFREFGLYGLNATGTAGSGKLINRVCHATFAKDNTLRLTRNLRITL